MSAKTRGGGSRPEQVSLLTVPEIFHRRSLITGLFLIGKIRLQMHLNEKPVSVIYELLADISDDR